MSDRAILFIPVCHIFSVYTSQSYIALFIPVRFVYRIHQCPRGGERLAGRYNADERLRRLLRAGRCAGRVRSVGTSREAGALLVAGQQVLARQQLPRLCGYLDVIGVVVEGR